LEDGLVTKEKGRHSRENGNAVVVLFKNIIFLDARLSFDLEALDRRGPDEV
jgi:hypothetical protein